MSEARKRPSAAFLGTEFNNFLFASCGIDRIGVQLSVVSALARLDMDPWEEAAKLSQLPRESAAQRLATWMARFPELASGQDDRRKTAKRLVALLPEPAHAAADIARRMTTGGIAAKGGAMAAFCLVALGLMVAGQIFMASRPTDHRLSGHAIAPVADTAPAPHIPGL